MPKISYLVSTYDDAQFLHRRLINLLDEQTEKDVEVLICNPNSPGLDGVIAEQWADRDDRVKYFPLDERNNYGEAWILLWEHATGTFVCNANADDLVDAIFTTQMYDFLYAKTYHFFSHPKELAFCYPWMRVVNEQGHLVARGQRPPFDRHTMSYECHAGPCVTWLNDEGFREDVDWDLMRQRAKEHVSAFDYWLWLYFMSLGFNGICLPETLMTYVQRPTSVEHQNYGTVSTYESLASISEFFPHHFKNKLRRHEEFADFNNLPDKERWVALRKEGKPWRE